MDSFPSRSVRRTDSFAGRMTKKYTAARLAGRNMIDGLSAWAPPTELKPREVSRMKDYSRFFVITMTAGALTFLSQTVFAQGSECQG